MKDAAPNIGKRFFLERKPQFFYSNLKFVSEGHINIITSTNYIPVY